jgi:hypothetical protein
MKLSEMTKACCSCLTLGIPVIRPASGGATEEGLGKITRFLARKLKAFTSICQ